MERLDPEDVKFLARETARQIRDATKPHWTRWLGLVMWRAGVLACLAWLGLMAWLGALDAGSRADREFHRALDRIVSDARSNISLSGIADVPSPNKSRDTEVEEYARSPIDPADIPEGIRADVAARRKQLRTITLP